MTWILLTDGVRDVAYALSFNLLPLYLDEIGGLSIQQIGWLELIFGIAMMAGHRYRPAGWRITRASGWASALGFALQFIALLTFVRVSGFWGFAGAWVAVGPGGGDDVAGLQVLDQQGSPRKSARHGVWPVQH